MDIVCLNEKKINPYIPLFLPLFDVFFSDCERLFSNQSE